MEEVELIKSVKLNMDYSIAYVKVAGVAKLQNVTHDGTCGYRCIAYQDGLPVEDIIMRFIQLSSDQAFIKAEELAKWCANLQCRYEHYRDSDLKRRHLDVSAYLSAPLLQVYADVFKCMFLLVRPHEGARGTVEIIKVIASNSYTSLDELYVINSENISFDLYVPIKNDGNGKSLFDTVFRNAAEAIMKDENMYRSLRPESTEYYVPKSKRLTELELIAEADAILKDEQSLNESSDEDSSDEDSSDEDSSDEDSSDEDSSDADSSNANSDAEATNEDQDDDGRRSTSQTIAANVSSVFSATASLDQVGATKSSGQIDATISSGKVGAKVFSGNVGVAISPGANVSSGQSATVCSGLGVTISPGVVGATVFSGNVGANVSCGQSATVCSGLGVTISSGQVGANASSGQVAVSIASGLGGSTVSSGHANASSGLFDANVSSDPEQDIGASTLIQIPYVRKDAEIVAAREKIASDFYNNFRSLESKEFDIMIGGNKIIMKKETTELENRIGSYSSIYSEPDFVSVNPYQFRMFSAIRRGDRLDVAPCWLWDESRKNAWLLLLILKSRCAKQYFLLMDPAGYVDKVCIDRDIGAKFKKFIADPSVPVNLEMVASRLKTYFSTGNRHKWNQDPNKPLQKFAEFSEYENNTVTKDSESSDEEIEFDFTRSSLSAYDINLGFKQAASIQQLIGNFGTYSNIIYYKRKIGFKFGDVVSLKNHLVDTRRFFYAGAFKPNNKMDSDVHIAEFFVFDSHETAYHAQLKKVNLSHMQRSIEPAADNKILDSMIECVQHFQMLVINHGKLPRIYKAIIATPPVKESKKNVMTTLDRAFETPQKRTKEDVKLARKKDKNIKKKKTPPVTTKSKQDIRKPRAKRGASIISLDDEYIDHSGYHHDNNDHDREFENLHNQIHESTSRNYSSNNNNINTRSNSSNQRTTIDNSLKSDEPLKQNEAVETAVNQGKSSARLFLIAQLQSYPEMKVKSWNWFYHQRYCLFCFRSNSAIESFETFMAVKNELGLKRNRSNKRKKYESESSESCSDSSNDSDNNTIKKLKEFLKQSEKKVKHKRSKSKQNHDEEKNHHTNRSGYDYSNSSRFASPPPSMHRAPFTPVMEYDTDLPYTSYPEQHQHQSPAYHHPLNFEPQTSRYQSNIPHVREVHAPNVPGAYDIPGSQHHNARANQLPNRARAVTYHYYH